MPAKFTGVSAANRYDAQEVMAVENTFIQNYLQILSQGIEEIWLDQSFTDVDINVANNTYHCHKLILSSMSAYFNAMFRSGMRESLAGSVQLHNIECETFEAVLRFMYTGCNVVSKENVEALLEAAAMLQVKCLQDQCESFLKKQIGPENCIGIWRLACNLNCTSLSKKSWTYILEFFPTVVNMEEFCQLSIEDLIAVIVDNDLNTSSEEEVCDAVLKWVEADPGNRQQELSRLLRHIRFPMMCSSYVKELSAREVFVNSEESRQIISDIYAFLTDPDPESSAHQKLSEMSRQFNHRQEEMLCVIGTRSRHPNPQATEIKCFSFRRDAEYTLAAVPDEPGACFGVCRLGDDIYVSGGYHGQTLFLRFVSDQNRWEHCSPMLEGRWGHSMVSIGSCIYIVGGNTRISQTLSSIEMYDPKVNECKIIGGLQIPVSFMPTATLGNRIYIFGGKMQDRTLSTKIQCFDTKKKACYILDDMPLVSSTASRVAVLDNTVYIFYRHGDIISYREGSNATVVGNMPHFDHFGVVPHEGQLMLVGSQSNQYSTIMFNPCTREMTPYTRTVNAALCNFYCLSVVISRQHMNPENKT